LRILWICKRPTGTETGDEIFDLKTVASLRALGCEIDLHQPAPVRRASEVAKLATGLLPYQRSRFANGANLAAIADRSRSYSALICSGERFDALVRRLSPPSILVNHNVTSIALPSLFPNNALAALGAARAGAWERRWYRATRFAAIGALSRRDLAYLESLEDRPKLLLLPPGMPPRAGLVPDAPLRKEVVVSGTFDWFPKRRDLLKFAHDYSSFHGRLPVRANDMPREAAHLLHPLPVPTVNELSEAIRFGLITDRFEAGHKLKTMAYIAHNQIVLSFSDVGYDFVHIPDHDFFIRKIRSFAEIDMQIDAISSVPSAILRSRFLRFQEACSRHFTWKAVATTLLEAARDASKQRYREIPKKGARLGDSKVYS
jgi:hypothetical protein